MKNSVLTDKKMMTQSSLHKHKMAARDSMLGDLISTFYYTFFKHNYMHRLYSILLFCIVLLAEVVNGIVKSRHTLNMCRL